jgi:hypothetical protein
VIGFNTIIGGVTPGAMNVISGNTESGILLGIQATQVTIAGNHIGTDQSGNILIPNRDGIVMGPGSSYCYVQNNLIKGNTQFGIFSSGLPDSALASAHHDIAGNTILLNSEAGIGISNNSHHILIGESNGFGAPNHIQSNGKGGVVFSNSFGTPEYNTIRKNSFSNNTLKGIDILSHCSNCQKQIFPPDVTGYVEVDPVSAVVSGTHHRAGSVIDIYTGDINTSGRYEGRIWLGSGIVNAANEFIFFIDNCACDIVATATDVQGNTSEFTDGEPLMTALRDPHDQTEEVMVYPNPFRGNVSIRFTLDRAQDVLLKIVDATGQIVITLIHEHLPAGNYEETWRTENYPEGMYFYHLTSRNDQIHTGKLIYLK